MSMLISVVNFTKTLKDEDVHKVLRAVNTQIALDFEPYWHISARLRLESAGARLHRQAPSELRGDAILYLWDRHADVSDAVGYHYANHHGLPFGFVFAQIAKELQEPWSVTLSHEALELIADPEANTLVAGPHPGQRHRYSFYWFEVCDPVQEETYRVQGVEVSNFVLPSYFSAKPRAGDRNDFLGRWHKGKRLAAFGVNPGGYLGYYDPKTHRERSITADQRAERRMKIKAKMGKAHRHHRYRTISRKARGGRARDK
jgi:hypothetical protein